MLRLGIDCAMSKGTAEALGVLKRVHLLGEHYVSTVGSWTVKSFAIVHDAPEPLGFVLHSNPTDERLLYGTDTQYIPPRYGEGCTILALEANFSLEKIKANVASGEVDRARKHRTMWNHQSIDTVLKFLKETDRSRLQEVWLLHLSDANADEQLFKRMVQEVTGCRVQIA